MPAYTAADVDIPLSVCSLTGSTTDQPCNNVGTQYAENLQANQRASATAVVLSESLLPCQGYRGPLHFLGDKLEAPFKLVQVGSVLNDAAITPTGGATTEKCKESLALPQTSSPLSSIRSSPLSSLGSTPPMSPMSTNHATSGKPVLERKALRLTVTLSANSMKRYDEQPPQSVKIEVFFNGEFAGGDLVAAQNVKDAQKITVEMTGKRIARLVEHAWILDSRVGDVDNAKQGRKQVKKSFTPSLDNAKVWGLVSRLLSSEANAVGFSESGQSAPTSDYLMSLACLDVPKPVMDMKSSTTQTYGVLDVVLTLGEVLKVGSSITYMKRSERLIEPDHRYDFTNEQLLHFQREPHPLRADTKEDASHIFDMMFPQHDQEPPVTRTTRSRTNTKPTRAPKYVYDSDDEELSQSAVIPSPKSMDNLQKRMGKAKASDRPITLPHHSPAVYTLWPLQMPIKSITFAFGPNKASLTRTLRVPMIPGAKPSWTGFGGNNDEQYPTSESQWLKRKRDTPTNFSLEHTSINQKSTISVPVLSEINRNCTMTYTDPGSGPSIGDDCLRLRNVRSTRQTSFRETEILFGVRFIVPPGAGDV